MAISLVARYHEARDLDRLSILLFLRRSRVTLSYPLQRVKSNQPLGQHRGGATDGGDDVEDMALSYYVRWQWLK